MDDKFAKTIPNINISRGFNEAALGLVYYTLDGKMLHANQTMIELFGFNPEHLDTVHLKDITHPEDQHKFDNLADLIRNDPTQSRSFEVRCFGQQGELLYVRILFCTMRDEDEKPYYIMAVIENLTPQLDSLEEKRLLTTLFETIANNVPSTVWLTNHDFSEVLFVNQTFCDLWQVERKDIIGKDGKIIIDRIHPDDQEWIRSQMIKSILENDTWARTYRHLRDDGQIIHLDDHGTVIRDNKGKIKYLLGTQRDVTDKIQYLEKLENLNTQLQRAYEKVKRLSEYDSLTNCLNRAAVMKRLSDALYQFKRYEIPSSLIYIDLNGFKQINDKYGHHAGDQILKSFVEHVQMNIRQTDVFGRIGGDEFLLLFPGATLISADKFIRKENKQFSVSIDLPNGNPLSLNLTYSTGIAELDYQVENIDTWVDKADREMYVDKISTQ